MKTIVEKATEFSRDFEVTTYERRNELDIILDKTIEFILEEIRETQHAVEQQDDPEIIDGFGDIAFIALNGIYKKFRQHGNNHEVARDKVIEVMTRICNANLGKKQPDGTIRYVNGKVQKPEGWGPPEYEDLF